jgi:hypothetical protein
MPEGVVVTETFLLGVFSGNISNCSFLECGVDREYGGGELHPLVLFGLVLGVRVLFLFGENKLPLRIIGYYQANQNTAHVTHSSQKGITL